MEIFAACTPPSLQRTTDCTLLRVITAIVDAQQYLLWRDNNKRRISVSRCIHVETGEAFNNFFITWTIPIPLPMMQ